MNIAAVIFLIYFIVCTIYQAVWFAKTSSFNGNKFSLGDVLGNILPGMMGFILIPIFLLDKIKFNKN